MKRIATPVLAIWWITVSLAAGAADAAEPPRVRLMTNLGDIWLEMYPDKAPKTVENFLRYVREGHYDGTIFHRVMDGFMIQGGGYTADLKRKQTRAPIENEADNGLKNRVGTIAMARTSDPHSATAQFFINVVDNFPLDHRDNTPRGWGYAVFGRVVQGMDVVTKIVKAPTRRNGRMFGNLPKSTIVIEKATIVETGEKESDR